MSDTQKTRSPLEHVNLRIPPDIRKEAQALAKEESTELIEVTEAHIYRRAIEFFLRGGDTKNIQNSQS